MATFEAIKDKAGQWHRSDADCDFLQEVLKNGEYETKEQTNLKELDERDADHCPNCFPQEARE